MAHRLQRGQDDVAAAAAPRLNASVGDELRQRRRSHAEGDGAGSRPSRAIAGPMDIKPTLTYTFEPVGDTTRFTRAMDVRPAGKTRLMEPFLRRMMIKNNASYVQNLKQLLETPERR